MTKTNKEKYTKLALSIVFDAIGMASFTLPIVGDFSDVVWAPVSAYIMTKMYKGSTGKVAGLVNLFEELMPFTDIVPTFTLTWIYQYVIKKKETEQIIDISE